jgi:hypothetical protein
MKKLLTGFLVLALPAGIALATAAPGAARPP